jgi:ribose transport system permease protein
MSSGSDAQLLSAVLIALACALVAGIANGILVGVMRLKAIIATIGMNALLYGAVFAVSGGVPRITTPLMSQIAGGKTLGLPNSLIFAIAIMALVSFVLWAASSRRSGQTPPLPMPPVCGCGCTSRWPMCWRNCFTVSRVS